MQKCKFLCFQIPTQTFSLVRGIRQGCPLPPHLFILCMEWLGHLIHSSINSSNWVPIFLSRLGPTLSHLFFADDLVIFGKADLEQAKLIKAILDKFCAFFGHQIIAHKMDFFFSKGVDEDFGAPLYGVLCFRKVHNLSSYLGVPLFHERIINNSLRFVVDKVNSRLQWWDARQLFLARKVTFAQLVLLIIPSYFMQFMMIPQGICKEIERIVRQFIQGSSEGSKNITLVNWQTICQPKACGGLGLRQLKDHNTFFMLKLGYNLLSNTDALWVRVLRSKYKLKEGILNSIHRRICSFMWRALSKIWPILRDSGQLQETDLA